MPAAVTIESSRPNFSTVFDTTLSTSASLEVSVWTKRAFPPLSSIWAATCSPPSSLTSAMATAAPSRANIRADERPMPEPPPVMMETLPSSSPAIILSFRALTP